jgi:hypothetical protein
VPVLGVDLVRDDATTAPLDAHDGWFRVSDPPLAVGTAYGVDSIDASLTRPELRQLRYAPPIHGVVRAGHVVQVVRF